MPYVLVPMFHVIFHLITYVKELFLYFVWILFFFINKYIYRQKFQNAFNFITPNFLSSGPSHRIIGIPQDCVDVNICLKKSWRLHFKEEYYK